MKEQIKRYCNSIGIENIGFIECRRFDELYDFYDYRKNNKLENEFEESDIEKRINPKWYMSEGKTIISIGLITILKMDFLNIQRVLIIIGL